MEHPTHPSPQIFTVVHSPINTPRTLAHKFSRLYIAPLTSFLGLVFVCVCVCVLLLFFLLLVFFFFHYRFFTLHINKFFVFCLLLLLLVVVVVVFFLFVCLFFHYHFFTPHKLHLSQDGQLKMQHPTHTHSPDTFTAVNGPTNVSK